MTIGDKLRLLAEKQSNLDRHLVRQMDNYFIGYIATYLTDEQWTRAVDAAYRYSAITTYNKTQNG